jgi:hypothetical protein
MAKQTITLCDICEKKDAGGYTLVSPDGGRLLADLCPGCSKRLIKDYQFTATIQTNRTRRVWDFEDIPRNTLTP